MDAESAPFGTWSDDESEGDAGDGIVFADVPCEAAIWREPFEMEDRIFLLDLPCSKQLVGPPWSANNVSVFEARAVRLTGLRALSPYAKSRNVAGEVVGKKIVSR